MKKRVYELAREYGMKGAELVKMLKSLGYTKAKTHMAVLDDADLIQVQALLEINGKIPEHAEEVPPSLDDGLGFLRKKKKRKPEPEAPEPAPAAAEPPDAGLEAELEAELAEAVNEVLPAPEETLARAEETAEGTAQSELEVEPGEPVAESAEEEVAPLLSGDAPEPQTSVPSITSEAGEDAGELIEAETVHGEQLVADESVQEESEEVEEPEGEPALAEAARSEETNLETPLEEHAADIALAERSEAIPATGEEESLETNVQKGQFVAPRPSRPKRQAKILGRIDLQKAPRPSRQAPHAPSGPVGPRPTMGRDRSKMFVRGAGGSRDAMSHQQLRDRERSRVQRRARPVPRGGRDRRKFKTDASSAAASRPESAVIAPPINVKTLSQAIGVRVPQLLLKLLQMTQQRFMQNTTLDEETAVLVAAEYGVELEVKSEVEAETALLEEVEALKASASEGVDATARPPVIAFLGHVDHGKTSLLDFIRKSHVTDSEAGGITQHIGAYQVTTPSGNLLTILDTPGHEAFTAMRARGANTTDIAVLVVACDDGVMPQTEEAIRHVQAAKVPIVVALNKIDRPEANVMRVKQQLAGLGLQAEDWGGQVQMIETSATLGTGINELLEAIDLVASLELELTAHLNVSANGTVLEAQISEGRGIVARLLVQDGTLRRGDILLAGEGYGRVRAIYNDRGNEIAEALPSSPVEVIGLSAIPAAGDRFYVVESLAKAKDVALERSHKARAMQLAERSSPRRSISDLLAAASGKEEQKELRLVVRADVQGSVEALRLSLIDLSTEDIKVELLQIGVGAITESDVNLAAASDGGILGFHVSTDEKARLAAEKLGIEIHTYQVIYELLDDVRAAMEDRLSPILKEKVTAHAEIRQLFTFSKVGKIAGCIVTDGTIRRSSRVRLVRDGIVIYTGKLASLRRGKDDVREMREGFECGLTIENYDDIKVGDVVECFEIEEERRTL